MAAKSAPQNSLSPWTMQRIETALRDNGVDVTAKDLKHWHRTNTSDSTESDQWDYYEGCVRRMNIGIGLKV